MKKILIVLMLIIFAGLAISSMLRQSGTCDEIAHHIPAGYSYLKKWDFRLNPSNPPLSRYIMAIPLIFMDLKTPFDDKSWIEANAPVFGRKLIIEYNPDKSKQILFLSRLMMLLVGILTGLLIYLMASNLYGRAAGLFALFIFSFSPGMIAHSTLATTDITATFAILLSIYAFWRFMRCRDLSRLVLAGIALGIAQLSKYSALMLYPVFILLAACEYLTMRDGRRGLIRHIALIFIMSVLTIWAGYGFRMKPFLTEAAKPQEKIEFVKNAGRQHLPFWNDNLDKKAEYFLKNTPMPLTTYTTGLAGVMKHSKEGHRMFFMGKWSGSGSPWYYAAGFLIKTPLPIILILTLSLLSVFRRKISKDELYLIIPFLVIFLAASLNKLQLGIRYILPVYPLCFIFCSRIITVLRHKAEKIIVFVIAVLLVLVTVSAWPHYLSYFNRLVGGPDNGWRALRDSNIDWGQDLPALADYLKKNRIKEIVLEYFGQDEPASYGIVYKRFVPGERDRPGNKVYAISADSLEMVKWTKDHRPTAKAGYSIFIYDFRNRRDNEQ